MSVIDTLILISQRPVVVTLAIVGAAFVVGGSLLAPSHRKPESGKPAQGSSPGAPRLDAPPNRGTATNSFASRLSMLGYVITGISVALFIIAGFVSDLRP